MNYPEEFKKKCCEVYPNWDDLHKALEDGNVGVGMYLYNSQSMGLSDQTILNATTLEELQAKARKNQATCDLYEEWGKLHILYKEQNP